MLFFGYVVSRGGYRVLGQWQQISAPYAAFGVIWVAAGPVMLAAAVGIFLSRGRHSVPIWAGSISAVCAGATLIAGVLSFVVPCAGPS